mmetsp:Transcript_13402/g.20957  ORF Transcript_13402/g.20957 Transcript_13402/m.20957 type:complete len:105 (+) Transcript_13402:1500-1814(+)
MMAIYGTGTFIMAMFSLFFLIIPSSDKEMTRREEDHRYIEPTLSTFRLSFVLIFIIFATGVAVHIFTEFGINYMFIFELDPHYKMTHWQLYKIGLILLFVLELC